MSIHSPTVLSTEESCFFGEFFRLGKCYPQCTCVVVHGTSSSNKKYRRTSFEKGHSKERSSCSWSLDRTCRTYWFRKSQWNLASPIIGVQNMVCSAINRVKRVGKCTKLGRLSSSYIISRDVETTQSTCWMQNSKYCWLAITGRLSDRRSIAHQHTSVVALHVITTHHQWWCWFSRLVG